MSSMFVPAPPDGRYSLVRAGPAAGHHRASWLARGAPCSPPGRGRPHEGRAGAARRAHL